MKYEDQVAMVEKMNAELAIELEPDEGSLHLMQKVYRDKTQPLNRRLQCARVALPYEFPKLVAVANLNGGYDFSEELETRRRSRLKMIDGTEVERTAGVERTAPPGKTAAEVSTEHMARSPYAPMLRRRL